MPDGTSVHSFIRYIGANPVNGMKAVDAIKKLRGIRCGYKNTSCPDQLAIALAQAVDGNNEKQI